jgi:hypothetical protein
MGRFKKAAEVRRGIRLHIRLTAEEHTRLNEQAAERGLTVSDLIRTTALNTKPRLRKADPERAALIKGLGELGKIGSNVNQIAHELHRDRIAGKGPRVPDGLIEAALYAIRNLSNHLIKLLSGGH